MSSTICSCRPLMASAEGAAKNKGPGWSSQLLGVPSIPYLSIWQPEHSFYGRNGLGCKSLSEMKIQSRIICSSSYEFEEQETASLQDRLGWINSREVPRARRRERFNFPKHSLSQTTSRTDGLPNEAERFPYRESDPEDLSTGSVRKGTEEETRMEINYSREDPWLIQKQSGGPSIHTNQAIDRVYPSLRGEVIDRCSAGDDQLSNVSEDEGTLSRENETARSPRDLGSGHNGRMGTEDLSIESSKKWVLLKRSNLIAKQVISVSNAAMLGFVSQLWVDLQMLKVEVVEVKPSLLAWETDEIPLSNLYKIGNVILAKNDDMLVGDLLVPNCEAMVGSDVLTESNVYLGKVRDYSFNLYNGEIVGFEMDPLGIPFIPAKMISTYLVMVDDIVDITRDCLLLRKGVEARIQRLSKGFLQSSIIEIEMMQAANFDGTTRFRGSKKGRKRMVSSKEDSNDTATGRGMNSSSSLGRAVPNTEMSTVYNQDNFPQNPRAKFSNSFDPKNGLGALLDSDNAYGTFQSTGSTSALSQTADQSESFNEFPSGEAENRVSKGGQTLPAEYEDLQNFKPGYGRERWNPVDNRVKKRNQA